MKGESDRWSHPDERNLVSQTSDGNYGNGHETWKIGSTWTKFLFPFLFDVDIAGYADSAHPKVSDYFVESQWVRRVWVEHEYDLAELDNMLPYVKQYLKLPDNHRRFRMNDACISPRLVFAFQQPSLACAFRIASIEMDIFYNGVGFISIEIEPLAEGGPCPKAPLTIEQVEQTNAQLASITNGVPFRVVGSVFQEEEMDRESKLFLDNEYADWCDLHKSYTLKSLLDELLLLPFREDDHLSITPMIDRFLPIYGALLLHPTRASEPIERLDEQFFHFAESHLTILRKTFTPNHISRFSQLHVDEEGHNYMPYHNVIHSQSLDGGFVLAYDNGLAHYQGERPRAMESFRTNYFYMMLVPFHQRLSILRYASEMANLAVSPRRGERARKIREQIYDFSSRCYFRQASVSEERNTIYRRWQSIFHVTEMFLDLKQEVHDIDNYLAELYRSRDAALRDKMMRRDMRSSQLFGLITLVFLPITITTQIIMSIPVLQSWIQPERHPLHSLMILFLMILFVACMLYFILRYVRRAAIKDV